MEKEISIATGSDTLTSVKNRNMALRRITTALQHKASLDDELTASAVNLFADFRNFSGCEKCFEEAITVMQLCSNELLRTMASRFQNLINREGSAD